MTPEQYIAALIAAITTLAGVVGLLYRTVLLAKDQLITTKDQQLAYREELIKSKDVQIAAMQAANQALQGKVDTAIDTLGDAVHLLEQDARGAPRRGQGQGR